MTEEQIALARRAVACKGWRWMPGMLTTCDLRVVDGGDEYVVGHRSGPTRDGGGWYDGEAAGLLPDLTDPATLGCLLALVREAWQDRGLAAVTAAYTHERGYQFRVVGGHHHGSAFMGMSLRSYGTESEALVTALEAAP